MVNQKRRRDRTPDGLQDPKLHELPEPSRSPIQDARPDRVLRLAPLRIHDLHLQNGFTRSSKCRFCSEGLEGVLETVVQTRPPEDGVAEGDRADQKRPAPPTRRDGSRNPPPPVLW